ncbi:malignant T-cell-amplified sequence 1 [Caerostris extrusa]|uniref:Malignant T-cell-amplified sequence 1 n=1 Tax=Caerostris extrusa TaxID=172846 RepID=A0AAV4P864_CAEEX|nr:malignant T-cell-amplified sequence 1 [Caerostris extrusa]
MFLFSRFDEKDHVSGVTQLKSSVQKGIRTKLLEQFPYLEDYASQILPKKENLRVVKCHDHIEIIVGANGESLFFRQREGPYFPTLRLLHKYPFIYVVEQVDRGAIRFVLSGANIMCPGLTSPGAKMTPVPKDTVVAIMAEGKEHALAVGLTSMTTDDIAKVNKGIGVENIHYLNDGLWQMKPVK